MMREVTSVDNPLLVKIRRLVRDPLAYRQQGVVWLEGEHLCQALATQGGRAAHVVASRGWVVRAGASWPPSWADDVVVVPDALFSRLSTLPSPAAMGALIPVPPPSSPRRGVASVVLDRVQDAGNVGNILRSAQALGCLQVLALEGTAALWSPKVLRAGMGAHFGLVLHERLRVDTLEGLELQLVSTSSHAQCLLQDARLPAPCSWVFGHEGQGVCAEVEARCVTTVKIAQPGGGESLNVAAAAAICLYESSRRVT